MSFIMTGTDYNRSSVKEREKLAFTKKESVEFCKKMCNIPCVTACVVLSTCNRTEVYVSCSDDITYPNQMKDCFQFARTGYRHVSGGSYIHCDSKGQCEQNEHCNKKFLTSYNIELSNYILNFKDVKEYSGGFYTYEGNELVNYIMELAVGLKSQILGEGQIVTQINDAITLSREIGCTDSYMETLFRTAVTAGKYTLSHFNVNTMPLSSAYAAADFLIRELGSLYGLNCVVIGNGNIGNLIQSMLVSKGCNVCATLRTYGKKLTFATAKGTKTISYDDRYKYIDGCDFVVSATKSPHFTLTYDNMSKLKNLPQIIVDLAVPLDVEPTIGNLCKCVNIDQLEFENNINRVEVLKIKDVANKFVKDFLLWQSYKLSLSAIENIKSVVTERILKSSKTNSLDTSQVVSKTVDILLGTMKESVTPESMEESLKKIKERARL